MNIHHEIHEVPVGPVETLGEANFETPYIINNDAYTEESKRIVHHASYYKNEPTDHVTNNGFEAAGPRKKIFFNPSQINCGIVTCGGLCPGLNDVIRSITLTCLWQYGANKVYGFRYGYNGLSNNPKEGPIELNPDTVDYIHNIGGTILASSRGPIGGAEMAETLKKYNINILYVIGGDGTFRGAHELAEEIKKQKLNISIICIPKTVDNDIILCETTFGFSTAIEKAREIINLAHLEAKAAWNGIGLIKLMGRDSGFIAVGATLGSNEVNYCLIPEAPIDFDGPNGFLERLKSRITKRHHAVIVVAEGVGQQFSNDETLKDKSGNSIYKDAGLLVKEKIEKFFKENDIPLTIKYFDPSYSIRSCASNARDSILCHLLGQNAVHAGMAGKTDMFVGYWNQHFTHVPLASAIGKRKKINPNGQQWQIISSTLEGGSSQWK